MKSEHLTQLLYLDPKGQKEKRATLVALDKKEHPDLMLATVSKERLDPKENPVKGVNREMMVRKVTGELMDLRERQAHRVTRALLVI